jgi:hypothetical protein
MDPRNTYSWGTPLGVKLTSVFWDHCCWSLGVESRGNATRKFTRRDQELFGSGVHARTRRCPAGRKAFASKLQAHAALNSALNSMSKQTIQG